MNIAGSIWDDVSTQLNKIYYKGLVIFKQYNAEKLHILSLNISLTWEIQDTQQDPFHHDAALRSLCVDVHCWKELA